MNTLTVEDALKELRKMFPGNYAHINDDAWAYPKGDPVREVRIVVGMNEPVTATTLTEAMAQVRKWKESQQS